MYKYIVIVIKIKNIYKKNLNFYVLKQMYLIILFYTKSLHLNKTQGII